MRFAYIALVLAAALPARAATPAGLTGDDWRQIRRSIQVPASFPHEAQLFGQGDPIGQQNAEFGISVALSGDTLVVGADAHDTPAGVDTGAAYVFVRSGTTWTLQQQLVASDAAASDLFGSAVAISGDTIVVGTPFDDTPGGTDAGSAYVFVRSGTTWTEQQKLLASDGAPADLFGSAVSISVDTVLVGAFSHDAPGGVNSGAAYAFVRSGATWSQEQELVAPDGAVSDLFGCSVAVSGDTAVAGACGDDTAGGVDAGSAYVFVRSGTSWTQQQKLVAADGAPADAFGCSVAVSGDTAVAGACAGEGPVGGANTGSVYVFVRAGVTWTQQQELSAPDVGSDASFGYSTSISGNTVAVGARYSNTTAGTDAGAAYVFVRSGTTWTQQQKLLAPDGAAGDLFGTSVSVSGDTVVAGASSADTPGGFGFNTGAVYVFARAGTTWTLQQKLRPPDSAAGDVFGYSVSVSGETLVVGAWSDDTLGAADSGSAYVFVRSGTTWALQQKIRPYDPTTGAQFGWSVSLSGETLVVGARSAGGAGAAYVFRRFAGTTWVQQQKLTAPAGALQFGQSVAVAGDTLAVGAPTAGAGTAGAAYVFVRSGATWTAQQTLVASDGATGDAFGSSVSISAATAVVGAPGDDIGVADTGSLYVFVRSGTTWTEQQKLLSDGAAGDALGSSVAISGNTVVGGAPGNDGPGGLHAGAAYVYVRSGTTWTQQQELFASDGSPDDNLGGAASISGNTLAVGAAHDDTPGGVDAGSAYVFVRSGATWTEQPQLLAPDGTANDAFGSAVSVSGNTVVVGAPQADDPQGALSAGSAHVFRNPTTPADLAVAKTDGLTVAVPGQSVTYTITVSNAGPGAANGATILDTLPLELVGATWTCAASPGSTCTAGGSGSIDDVFDLLVGGTLTYTVTGTVDPAATGFLINTATVGGITDPDPADNSATDAEPLQAQADLGVTKTDSADPVAPNDPLSYTVTLTNAGPSDATGVTVTDALPAGVTFVSSSPGPPTCNLAGATLTCNLGALAAANTATVTINVTVNASAGGILVNTAVVSGGEPDPNASNNSASAATAVGRRDGELTHGMDQLYDLAANPGPVADEDVFRINQKPYSSYEVVVDATSGDIGAAGPLLQRIGADGSTVLQNSLPVGAGFSRSLRWRNTSASEVEGEVVRIRSAGCGTDCGTDDVYRIRVYETTYAVPRFNNAGTQVTVLILQNPTNDPISGEAYFRITSGAPVAVHPFSLNPKATLILNTATLPGASGVSGAIAVAHNGGYASLVGKTVALEPSTGFSFDSPLEPRAK
jgi:uncharacterized repeat protein (TIGR01451 family)